ncbi:MAG: hypothetical protein JSR24_05835 [Proteobacteria bacterium]|nr:hypothetical protein [Pseudomonadota bacterium]
MFGIRFRAGVPPSVEVTGAVERLGPLAIVGDVRLDARGELLARLPAGARDLSDKALCLHAYVLWGERCVEQLAGDFCFALWDDKQGCLVAARDRLGIKPLFHARAGGAVLVSDSLDWIMGHAEVSRALDEVWIGDFLAAGLSLDFARTVRRDVARVPPAHLLKVDAGGETVRRYWRLEIGDPVDLHARQVPERFVELVQRAIGDRLPSSGPVGISMSGGLDSTTLAACAVAVTGDPARVVGECYQYERLMTDDEGRFATLAAERLGIRLRLTAVDDLTYDPRWRERGLDTGEPLLSIVLRHHDDVLARGMAAESSVWFYGEGPDNALHFDRDPYFAWLRARRDWGGFGRAALDYARVKGMSGWGATLGRALRRRDAGEARTPWALPNWIEPGFARRLHLAERIGDLGVYARDLHPWHPTAVGSFQDPIWPSLFDKLREGTGGGLFEWRHPFLDLRVLEFMIALPPVPWGWFKHLLRVAMRGRLPDEILTRAKTPLAVQPLLAALSDHPLPPLSGDGRLAAYVDARALSPDGGTQALSHKQLIAVHALDYWLARE